MNALAFDFSLLLNPNELLTSVVSDMGVLIYVILFLIIFAETGLVVAPFLPGDSLLFAAGALAGAGRLQMWPLMATLLAAAVVGDAVNYWIGRSLGRKILERSAGRLIKPEHIVTTEAFFERHGGMTIVLARFVPFVRTFAPFVAGMCDMPLFRFWAYNITGAVVWVALFTGAGYIFGNIPWIEENLALGMLVVVVFSILPVAFEGWRRRRANMRAVARMEKELISEAEPAPSEI